MNLQISTVDAVLVLVFLAASIAFGIWIGRKSKGMDGYLLGGRDLSWWVILGSIVATETSTVTFLSIPGTLSNDGGNLHFLQLALGYMIGRLIVIWLFMPRFFDGKPFTAYEVLRNRFGPLTSRFSSLLFIVTRTLADGLRLYLTAIVLEKAVGIGLETSVIVIGIATIIYTFFGGMKSVVWNDCIQLVIYLAGACIAGWIIISRLGFDVIRDYAIQHDKLDLINTSTDFNVTYTLLAGIVGGVYVTMASHGTDQMMVQRYLCAKNRRHASVAVGLSGPMVFLQFALFLFLGIALACYYGQQTDTARSFDKPDEVFASFIVEEIPIVLTGLVMAAVFSAAMSTLSSSLNSSAAAVVNDFLRAGKKVAGETGPGAQSPDRDAEPSADFDRTSSTDRTASTVRTSSTDRSLANLSRVLTLIFGVLQMGVAVLADQLIALGGDSIQSSVIGGVLAIAGFVTGIILGVFFLGILSRGRADLACVVAMMGGIIVMTYVAFGTEIAWTWYAFIGSTTTYLLGVAAQWVFARLDTHPTD